MQFRHIHMSMSVVFVQTKYDLAHQLSPLYIIRYPFQAFLLALQILPDDAKFIQFRHIKKIHCLYMWKWWCKRGIIFCACCAQPLSMYAICSLCFYIWMSIFIQSNQFAAIVFVCSIFISLEPLLSMIESNDIVEL